MSPAAPSHALRHCLATLKRYPLPFSSANRSLDRPFYLADPTCLRIQRYYFCSFQCCLVALAILTVSSSSLAAPLLPLPHRTPLLLSSTTSTPSVAPNTIALAGHLFSFSPLQPLASCYPCLPLLPSSSTITVTTKALTDHSPCPLLQPSLLPAAPACRH
ncbi:hypothetical protein B296_00008617 [Ensete ventricosum]|uniref:Uncharacterized protein n=1 Tax=Ensete ventricosum TaxID=4639 RepID=A0A427A6R6_ENSVE|nr:hypothetical protein B296_00008617 [Ensete ventricosum]